MAGTRRKHPDQLQNKRGGRYKPLVVITPAWDRMEVAAMVADEIERQLAGGQGAKARVAREKARDARGRFVRANAPAGQGAEAPRTSTR